MNQSNQILKDVPKSNRKVVAHADEAISLEDLDAKSRPQQLLIFKRFLKIENHRIKLAHRSGVSGFEIASRRAELIDLVLKRIFDDAFRKLSAKGAIPPIALLAVGGYGRGVLNPGSDIDILFLSTTSTRALSKETNDAIEKVLYLLWDIGFDVGHTRSAPPRSAWRRQSSTSRILPPMIESRFLAGNDELFAKFKDVFYRKCVIPLGDDYLQDPA